MSKQQLHDNYNPSLPKEEIDARSVLFEDQQLKIKHDLATEQLFDTQHSDGHTYNPQLASQQGLTYTPPHDPAVLPSNNLLST